MREGEPKLVVGLVYLATAILAMSLLSVLASAQSVPQGATLTAGASSRGTDPASQTAEAQAGNITALNIDQTRITDIWQGFFGNVSGAVTLEDASGSQFYDWTLAEVTGEVYATRNTIEDWTQINCTNSTHWESEETTLNIPVGATDGINETFNSTNHDNFFVGNRIMTGCRSTRPYNSTGLPGDFWNILLNSNSTNTVYVSLLKDGADAFNGGTADFELLVPTNRQTGQATYYFYAELS